MTAEEVEPMLNMSSIFEELSPLGLWKYLNLICSFFVFSCKSWHQKQFHVLSNLDLKKKKKLL